MIIFIKFLKWMYLWNECWYCKVFWYGNVVKGFFGGGDYLIKNIWYLSYCEKIVRLVVE